MNSKNKIVTEGDILKVYFRSGGFFICDSELLDDISKYTWHQNKRGYAATNIKRKKMYAHIFIMGKKENYEIDHINRNKLDNRKSNLRFVSHIKNMHNKDFSRVKGNNPDTGIEFRDNRYIAHIRNNNKKKYLGSFLTLEEAKRARKEAEVFYWGEQVST